MWQPMKRSIHRGGAEYRAGLYNGAPAAVNLSDLFILGEAIEDPRNDPLAGLDGSRMMRRGARSRYGFATRWVHCSGGDSKWLSAEI